MRRNLPLWVRAVALLLMKPLRKSRSILVLSLKKHPALHRRRLRNRTNCCLIPPQRRKPSLRNSRALLVLKAQIARHPVSRPAVAALCLSGWRTFRAAIGPQANLLLTMKLAL